MAVHYYNSLCFVYVDYSKPLSAESDNWLLKYFVCACCPQSLTSVSVDRSFSRLMQIDKLWDHKSMHVSTHGSLPFLSVPCALASLELDGSTQARTI